MQPLRSCSNRIRSRAFVAGVIVVAAAACARSHPVVDDAGADAGMVPPDGGSCGPLQPLCARDPFVPPFPVAGAPGWRESVGEACFPVEGYVAAAAVAASSAGVTTLVATSIYDDPYFVNPGWVLSTNDGTGWATVAHVTRVPSFPFYASVLAVAPDARTYVSLVEVRDGTRARLCDVARIAVDGAIECFTHPAGSDTVAISFAGADAYVLSATDVRRVGDGTLEEVFTLPVADGFLPKDLWTDGTTTYVVGLGQSIVVHTTTEGASFLANVPAGDFTTIVGSSATDLFVGTLTGSIVHFDGSAFDTIELPGRTCGIRDQIIDLFLDDTTVHYATPHSIGSVASGQPATDFATWACDDPVSVSSMSGSVTRHERYFTLDHPPSGFRQCGSTHVVVHSAAGFRLF